MKWFLFVFALFLTMPVFADDVCPAGFTVQEYIPKEYRFIPADYTPLEYIESTGTQYIDTGVRQGKFVHDIKFSNTTKRCLMGYSGNSGAYWGANSAKSGYEFGNGVSGQPLERKTIIYNNLNNNNITLTVDGNTHKTSPVIPTNNYSIFHITGTIFYSDATLYGFKAYNANNELIRYLWPAKRNNDSEIGMYDTVTQTFFPNSGAGKFTAGPEDKYNTINLVEIDCIACPYNTYKPDAGNTECTPCPTGTFSPIGSMSISDCAKILHVGNYDVYMPVGKRTEHGLCTMFDGVKYCADVYERQ